MHKNVKEVYDLAVSVGFREERYNGHYRMKHPNGKSITIPNTPSDWRSLKNTEATIRKLVGQVKARTGRGARYDRRLRGSGFNLDKILESETKSNASVLIDRWLARMVEIDRQLAEIKKTPVGRMEEAEDLVFERAELARKLRQKHQPVPELEL